MAFPTVEEFEQNIEQITPIIKWRELPESVIYHVKSVGEIDTPSKFVSTTAMFAEVQDRTGNSYKTWLPARLCVELKDYAWNSREAFVRPNGLKQSQKNHETQFYDYDIIWR